MIENIEVLCHSSIKIIKNKTIYIDPYKIEQNYNDADIIFITHTHYDHYSIQDINKIKKQNTIIVGTEDLKEKAQKDGISKENIITVEPNKTYQIEEIKIQTIPAYNKNKPFHPKSNGWVGYIIEINKIKYYIAGDTDITEENKKVKCDVAFVPVRRNIHNDIQRSSKTNKRNKAKNSSANPLWKYCWNQKRPSKIYRITKTRNTR